MTTYLKDYQPYPYSIPEIALIFDLDPSKTVVEAIYTVSAFSHAQDLVLYGSQQTLVSVSINQKTLASDAFELTDSSLTIPSKELVTFSGGFELAIKSYHSPESNLTLQGLYTSGDMLCTQCEPHGMRHITYHPDRPDLLSRYRVTIRSSNSYDYLLSNGNLIHESKNHQGKEVTWFDPHPKPSYLFALVAGNFDLLKDSIVQKDGDQNRTISLEIYTPIGEKKRASRAMKALKAAMKWDEQVYGLSYDLDRFMIVAVDDFNAGAMENKGLNIFNAPQILSDPCISEDEDFLRIDRIVAHEYFHNWSGNRVTLRDWFQLTLKEGLTVFREQQFSGDHHNSTLERLSEIAYMHAIQFREDRSALSHPILPQQYEEIDNFYTATVYDKGAEVVRMLSLLLGKDAYYRAMREYFHKFDGKAITALDFYHHMISFSDFDLTQFERWYHTKGTPTLLWSLDGSTLTLQQHHSDPTTKPLLIPLAIALHDRETGESIPFQVRGCDLFLRDEKSILIMNQEKMQVSLEPSSPSKDSPKWFISLNAGLCAPILLKESQTKETLLPERLFCFAKNRSNPLLQGTSCQEIYKEALRSFLSNKDPLHQLDIFFANLLQSCKDPHFATGTAGYCLKFPSIRDLLSEQAPMRFEETELYSNQIQDHLASTHYHLLEELYNHYETKLCDEQMSFDQENCSLRTLASSLLHYIARTEKGKELLARHLDLFSNRTLHLKGLSLALEHHESLGHTFLDRFYEQFKEDPLTITKWFSLQAMRPSATIETIEQLKAHSLFDHKRPRVVRATISTFIHNIAFSRDFERTYPWLIEQIQSWDKNNPHLAASLLSPFKEVEQLDQKRQKLVFKQLERLLKISSISEQTREIATACWKKAQERLQ